MLKLAIPIAALTLSLIPAAAQTVIDVDSLVDLDDVDVITADGENIGEVEEALVGPDGSLAAIVVEAGGFLGIGDENRVLPMDRLTFQDGDYTTDLTSEEIESLPEWDG